MAKVPALSGPGDVCAYTSRLSSMRVALIHDWLTAMRGGERVLAELCELFPEAPIFTLFHQPGTVCRLIEAREIRCSFLNRIPGIGRSYRHLLPFFPLAVSTLDVKGFDLILSVSHAVAKSIRKPPGSIHVCYCLTPMRYIWDMQQDYFQYADSLRIGQTALRAVTRALKSWDRATATGVDHFIAVSRHVQERIARHYNRRSEAIYPPVDTGFFTRSSHGERASYYLVVSALVPYKRIDLAIDAFNRLGRPLIIAGAGPDLARLKKRAERNIDFVGFVSNETLRDLYRHCRALVIPGREDFGLASLEAQACGRPVIAHAAGGSLESVTDPETGILFSSQTVQGLIDGVKRFEEMRFDPERLRTNAERFSRANFRQAVSDYIRGNWRPAESPQPATAMVQAIDILAGRKDHITVKPRGRHPSVSGISGLAKRILDIVLSLLGLSLLGLPLLVIGFLIRRDSPGPALFRQVRTGLWGHRFVLLKLRTMVVDAEKATGPVWAVREDPRCTRLGGFLRRYGIDELPQLWNVLMGHMSLVGPRPERPEFEKIIAAHFAAFERRLEVPGGITGLAQIRGWRGDTPMGPRLEADLEYIERWSFLRDLSILCKTPFSLLRPIRLHQAFTNCLNSQTGVDFLKNQLPEIRHHHRA